MKKTILALLLVLAVLALTGCSSAVKDTIAAIDAIAQAESKSQAISEAEDLYNALDDKQKEKVTNSSILRVAQAERAIDNIGYVSDFSTLQPLEKRSKISSASSAYNRLTAEEKKLVTNAAELTTAKELLSKAEAAVDRAQTFAEKLFCKCAKNFKRSETINVKNVWYSSIGGNIHDFTFEFELRNAYGITETVYYGNSMGFMDLSDEEISLASTGLILHGSSFYFKEGETDAMDSTSSIKLDAAAIQTYFRRNR